MRISVRRGCWLLMQSRTVYHWQSRRDDRAITLRIREIAETRIRYGCPRIHIQLRREGWPVNHKKTHRIYCPEGRRSGDNPAYPGNSGNPDTLRLPAYSYSVAPGGMAC
ncbi:IS3 family transposase [Salmonella enterica]|uniref:IS3 family transposase n=1 Tax=Salmonella enterica TaxID=28901 RepID=UPI00391F1E47